MSDENDGTETESGSGKGLRAQLETALSELKAEREVANQFRASQRGETVKGILKAKGIPESAARLYSGDDVTEGAVSKWVDEYKDLFAPGTGSGQGAGETDPNDDAARRVADASYGNSSSVQAGGDNRILGDPAEIMRALQTLPYPELVKLGYMPKDNQLYNPKRH